MEWSLLHLERLCNFSLVSPHWMVASEISETFHKLYLYQIVVPESIDVDLS
jgi:hypothetical protein